MRELMIIIEDIMRILTAVLRERVKLPLLLQKKVEYLPVAGLINLLGMQKNIISEQVH